MKSTKVYACSMINVHIFCLFILQYISQQKKHIREEDRKKKTIYIMNNQTEDKNTAK